MWSTPVSMKKLSLYMVDADAQKAAMTLARMAVIHPLEKQDNDQLLAEFPATSFFRFYHDLYSLFRKFAVFIYQPFNDSVVSTDIVTLNQLEVLDEQLKVLWAQVSNLEEQLRNQNEKIKVIRQLSNSLQKFASLDLDLSRLRRQGRFLRIVVGTVPSGNFIQLKRALSLTNFMIKSFYSGEGIQHTVVFGSSQQQKDVQELLNSADFRGLSIPEEFSGSPSELQADMDQQLEQTDNTIKQLKQELSDLLSENMPTLQTAHDLLILARPYASLAMVLRGRGGLVSLQGWVPARCQQEIKLQLEHNLAFPFHIEFFTPEIEEFDSVPSLLKKSWLLKPFQGLVKNFGIPGYREVDPSGLFALSYIIMFGMMFGDIGHGAVISLVSLMFRKRFPGVTIVGVLAGLSSIFFGFVYGSLFGYEQVVQPLWMSPMHDPVKVLLVAVVWGASFLVIANLLAIRNYIATGLTERALYDGKGIAGLVFYLAAFYVVYQLFAHNRFGWLEGLLLLLPMAVMLQFKWRQSSGGLPERALVVLIEGLEHVISDVSGTLSFLRVAAFSLNHIALATAVFAIAGMMDAFGHGLTIVLGNIFIIVLEGAIVAIQCLRLEYYEGFSRFFTGKGKAFEPLKI
jgi:V/A-type H+-transporting ATPase subunit I